MQDKRVRLFCCCLARNKAASCLEEGGCCAREDPCLLFLVKKLFQQAGIQTVSDERILHRLEKIQAEII